MFIDLVEFIRIVKIQINYNVSICMGWIFYERKVFRSMIFSISFFDKVKVR